jgi:hypothetical protein
LADESVIYHSALGPSCTADIGWSAHTNADGTAVVADDNGLNNDLNVAAAGTAKIGVLLQTAAAGGGMKLFDSREGVDIYVTIAGAVIPVTAVLNGYITYVVD